MIIGILSDTHDHIDNLRASLTLFRNLNAQVLLHAGDYCSPFMIPYFRKWELHGVFGNNDGDHYRLMQRFSEIGAHQYAEFMDQNFGGKRIAMYHGTQQGITDALIGCGSYDLVITGHTHEAVNRLHGRTLHINPGAANGFGKAATVALYDTVTTSGEIIGIGP